VAIGWSDCPGCGLRMPDTGGRLDRRRNVSPACWHLYGEVTGYELTHLPTLGRFHQLTVDAYGAQHPGSGARPIGVAFGLIGLHLALERGLTGLEVQGAHRQLAARFGDWPTFERPERQAPLTVLDVAMAGSPEEHGEIVQRWAAAVWASWHASHAQVLRLIDERLLAEARATVADGIQSSVTLGKKSSRRESSNVPDRRQQRL
jgi:uncharacterized protein DUF5946